MTMPPIELPRPWILAGPCAVESERQVVECARVVRAAGAHLLRGGAFKPRTRPRDFQGLGSEGLAVLQKARLETGLPIVTEAMDEASLQAVGPIADWIQIGARNMHNGSLLRRAGAYGKPVMVKRGFGADVDEWLHAADYALNGGASTVILCERGIRTFSRHSRFTLDLSVIPALRRRTSLPVIVDPSHATGNADAVPAMARAAVAAGADGVMLEVHPDPSAALCDGPQALALKDVAPLTASLRRVASALAATREGQDAAEEAS